MPEAEAETAVEGESTDSIVEPGTGAPQQLEGAAESQDGGTGDATDSGLAAHYEGMTADQFDAFINGAPKELQESSAALREIARRGEQRAMTQVQQERSAVEQRLGFYESALQLRQEAEQQLVSWLDPEDGAIASHRSKLADAVKYGDLEAVERHTKELDKILGSDELGGYIAAFAQGEAVRVARASADSLRQAIGKYEPLVGDMTDDEERAIVEARREDIRKGTQTAPIKMIDLLVARAIAKGKADGKAEAEKALKALSGLGERVEAVARAKNGTAPRVDGAGGDAKRRIQQEMAAIDVTTPEGLREWQNRQDEFRRRLAEIGG